MPSLAICGDRAAQLNAAVAAQRAQQVAGEAFGMEPDQHRLGRIDLADDDGEMLLAAVARPPGEDAGVLGALERHARLRYLLQGPCGRFLVGGDVCGLDIEQILLARPVAPLVAGIAAQRTDHHGGQQAGDLGQLDRRLGDLRGAACHRSRQMAERDVPACLLALVRAQDDVDRYALRQVEGDRLVALRPCPRRYAAVSPCRSPRHADGWSPAPAPPVPAPAGAAERAGRRIRRRSPSRPDRRRRAT